MKFLLAVLLAVTFINSAQARRYSRPRLDSKFPNGYLIEKQTWTNPVLQLANNILSDGAGNTSAAAVTVSSGYSTIDLPRNISITPTGSTGDVAECTITVTGTNFDDDTITETFAFAANASSATTGSKAFKTITSIAFPASCEDSPYAATWDIGMGSKLGLSRCMENAADYFSPSVDGTRETTDPTTAASSTALESNTVDFDTAYDGAKDFRMFFVQSHCN